MEIFEAKFRFNKLDQGKNMPRVAVFPLKCRGKLLETLTERLETLKLDYKILDLHVATPMEPSVYDIVLLVGTDRDFLDFIHKAGFTDIPIVLVSPPGYSSFFATTSWDDLRIGVEKISEGDFRVEDFSTLEIKINDSKKHNCLNEVAIFADKSGMILDYTLLVDGEVVWRDSGDGLIVSTPIGSTGYALSAGGPIVARNANVVVIVPVNSLNPMRRPIVVSDSSAITVRDISCRVATVAVIDGVVRERVKESVVVRKSGRTIRLIRFEAKILDSMARKRTIALELEDFPPSVKFIYKMLEMHGSLTMRELVELTSLPPRTVRYALKILVEKGVVERITSLRDARVNIYRLRK